MAIKQEMHSIKGIQRDLTVSKFNPEYAFDARNIRITARDNTTLLSVTNEKGTKEIPLSGPINGELLGYCVLNKYATLFTKGDKDYIYRIEKSNDNYELVTLFSGNLGFEGRIETLGFYETEDIQKVYWVDGKNPTRYINIVATNTNYTSSSFDFAPEVELRDELYVETLDNGGSFPSGVVQYAFSYFNTYGAETNIVNQSPLYYTHIGNRAGSPEESTSNSFRIYIRYPDYSFEYIRLYSIFRTSIDATPTVKIVTDIKLDKDLYAEYIDTNTSGSIIDPTTLLYVGGESIVAGTITQKDNTMFLGNLELKRDTSIKEVQELIDKNRDNSFTFITEGSKRLLEYTPNNIYNYTTQLKLDSSSISTFKTGETYRVGIQGQYKTGRWSDILYIDDYTITRKPNMQLFSGISGEVEGYDVYLTVLLINLPDEVHRKLGELGYKRIRSVVVYPTGVNRSIVCQGIVCPTVDRYSTSDTAVYSSWFARPFLSFNKDNPPGGNVPERTKKDALYGSYAEFMDGYSLDKVNRSTEFGMAFYYNSGDPALLDIENGLFVVNSQVVTLHSPDIDFTDLILSDNNLNFRIVGYAQLNNCLSSREVVTSTVGLNPKDSGFYDRTPTPHIAYPFNSESYILSGGRMLISGINWFASPVKDENNSDITKRYDSKRLGWLISPWMPNDAIINSGQSGNTKPTMLQYNRLSNLRYSALTSYFDNKYEYSSSELTGVEIFSSDSLDILKIDNLKEGASSKIYHGNTDLVLTPPSAMTSATNEYEGYTKLVTALTDSEENDPSISSTEELYTDGFYLISRLKITANAPKYFNAPTSIKYKSTPHAVFGFKDKDNKPTILPDNGNNPGSIIGEPGVYVNQKMITEKNVDKADGLWIGELYRTVDKDIIFGGKTEEALSSNRWVVGGSPTTIWNSIRLDEGDTYFQRYDCLKTYPFTFESQNSITEIVSFMCETRVNIDGRYDRNRGNDNNLTVSPANFNLINKAYSQRNTFFPQSYLRKDLFNTSRFPNSVTWSLEKHISSIVDEWTNITMTSTLDLDGDKGEIVSLNTYNNEIFCFQETGLSNILFNSRVQIPTSDEVPIEITNGLKVGGKRYVSNSIGCDNKWTIAESPSGLYFIDTSTNSIYLFNGQLSSLSDKLGFREWVGENIDKSFITFYDKNNNDVYFTGDKECLCYSELLGQFTSFMSYEGVPAMFNIGSDFFSIKNNKLWKNFSGEYNMFYDSFKPYSVTVVANADEPYDKVFNTIEFRADSWDGNTLISDKTFDTLEVWNEYQSGKSVLNNQIGNPSSLKKKFRVWRANIPRDSKNPLNRIRNTWAYVKLAQEDENNKYRTELHDIMIHYSI
jgi:hypothetical protein